MTHKCKLWDDSIFTGYYRRVLKKKTVYIPSLFYECSGWECDDEVTPETISFCPFCGKRVTTE